MSEANTEVGEITGSFVLPQNVEWHPKHNNDLAKWITVILSVVGLTVGAAVWATGEHSDIKSWTAGQDYVTKEELKETIRQRYVPKEEFAKVEQSLIDQKEDIKEIKEKLDKLLDAIHDNNRRHR